MRHFPIFLDIAGKTVLVVGGGAAAAAKAAQLTRAGAAIRSVDMFDHVGDAVLVVCTDAAQGATVALAARAAKVPVNVVDRPELCNFIWPAIVERDPIAIAISTSGASPVLARHLRMRIEMAVPVAFGRVAAFAGRLRARVARAIPDLAARRSFWDRILSGPAAACAMAGDEPGAVRELDRALLGAAKTSGEIAFVAVPDDPDLLTIKDLRRLQGADAIFHPEGIDPRILDFARRDAERVVIGPAADPAMRVAAGQLVVWFGTARSARAAVAR